MLEIYDKISDSELLIWACECRNSNQIMVILADNSCANMYDSFNEKAYKTAKYFDKEDYDSVVNYAFNVIKSNYSQNFIVECNTSFKMHKCLADLQKIANDSNKLDYEDYYDLATFEDLDNFYFCDLIILEGKLGLRFSKYTSQCGEFDNIFFKEWEPDLTSSISLMLGMQAKLKEFVDEEIGYNISVGI